MRRTHILIKREIYNRRGFTTLDGHKKGVWRIHQKFSRAKLKLTFYKTTLRCCPPSQEKNGRKKGMMPFAGIIIIRETDRDVSREKNSKDNSCSTKIFRSSDRIYGKGEFFTINREKRVHPSEKSHHRLSFQKHGLKSFKRFYRFLWRQTHF